MQGEGKWIRGVVQLPATKPVNFCDLTLRIVGARVIDNLIKGAALMFFWRNQRRCRDMEAVNIDAIIFLAIRAAVLAEGIAGCKMSLNSIDVFNN